MPLPHNALVLVADGTKHLFLRNHGDENQIDLRMESHDARQDRKERYFRTDAPGTMKQSFGFGHSTWRHVLRQNQAAPAAERAVKAASERSRSVRQ